ncbi:alpha/beta hydrolase [Lysobacter tyrosinilyticus]
MRALFKPTIAVALFVVALAVPTAASAVEPGPHDRAAATRIIADMRKIVVPGGIERQEKVHIGGIDQWITIRGNDPRNPVLLMLHGGPGWVSMPTSWYFQRGWEEYFTVVQWDQRGAGKTYGANDPAAVAPTMTIERMVADSEEMVALLRRKLGKEKIFVLGHSWGSYLGLQLAQRHPDWLHAYIGVGQLIDGPENERRGWAWTMEQAQRDRNAEAIRELQSIAPYAESDAPLKLQDLFVQRKWLNRYGGMVYGRTGGDAESAAVNLSPEYSDADLANIWTANEYSMDKLLAKVLTLDQSHIRDLRCPLILFLGRHDVNASSTLTAEWYARVHAPSKQLVWFENSGHEVMNEEPGKMLLSLVQIVRPIAERAGDAPNTASIKAP